MLANFIARSNFLKLSRMSASAFEKIAANNKIAQDTLAALQKEVL
jgi:hypothetical protein